MQTLFEEYRGQHTYSNKEYDTLLPPPSYIILLIVCFCYLQSLEEQFPGHDINYNNLFKFEEDFKPHIRISVSSSEASRLCVAMDPKHSMVMHVHRIVQQVLSITIVAMLYY